MNANCLLMIVRKDERLHSYIHLRSSLTLVGHESKYQRFHSVHKEISFMKLIICRSQREDRSYKILHQLIILRNFGFYSRKMHFKLLP